MENLSHETNAHEAPQLTSESKALLSTTARWTKFIATIQFIGIGFMLIFLIFLISVGAESLPEEFRSTPGAGIAMGVYVTTILISVAIQTILAYFLYTFGKHTQRALRHNDTPSLTVALRNMKNYWLVIGVLMIITLALIFFGILGIMFGAMMA